MEISLREIKKARNKIALYEAMMTLIGDKMFNQVMLDDICRKAEVSRVTFFKFFKKKEDLLIYFMRIWLTERVIEIETNHKRGFSAVRQLLDTVVDQYNERPGIMASLISFLAEMNMHPTMPELSDAEIMLLFPDHVETGKQIPNMYYLFRQSMTEASEDGELKEDITVDSAVKVIFTIFYGAYLTAQLYGSSNISDFYETNLSLLEKK